MPKCPKCGSSDFHYELRSGGTTSRSSYYRTGSKKSWIIPSGMRSHSSNRKQIAVGICPNCGYTKRKNEASGCSTILGLIVILSIISAIVYGCIDTKSRNNSTSNKSPVAEIWAVEYTPLEDFDYYIDHDQIFIKDYKGRNEKVYIASKYTVDGKEMVVEELEGVFALDRISSAIISPGIKKMKSNIFNSCGVKNVYLPASLEDFDGWNYFHNGEKLYYEGTEEQFKSICKAERKDVDFTQIIFNTSLSELLQVTPPISEDTSASQDEN